MADTNRDDMSQHLNFGIQDTTSVLGNLKAIDGFLSGDIVEDEEETEEEETEEETQLPAKKKPVAKGKPIKKAVAVREPLKDPFAFEQASEEEENDTEEEEEEEKDETDTTSSKGKKEEAGSEEEEDSEEETASDNPYEDLAKDLVKLGVLTQESEDEDLPKSGDELLAKFNAEKQKGAMQWLDGFLSRFGEDRQELFEAVFVKGVELRDYIPVYNEVQSLEALDMTNERNQELVYREFYKRLKFSPDEIENKVQKAKDYGDLESESKTFQKNIVAQDKEILASQEQEKVEAIANKTREEAAYKQSISKILKDGLKTREFKGIPIDEKTVNAAFDFLNTKKYKTTDGQYLTEFDKFVMDTKKPENHENRVLLALLKLSNFDFTKITKRAVSRESNELFQTFAQKKVKKTAGTKAASATSKSWLSL